MLNLGILAIAVAVIIFVGALYVTWRDRRRAEDADQSASLSGGPKEPA